MFEWVWTTSPILWLLAAIAVAVALLAFGWIGRRPRLSNLRCQTCNVDCAPTAVACPQCSSPLAGARPHGRQKRPLPLLLGAALVLAIGLPAAWLGFDPAWRTKAPDWALHAALDFGDESAAPEIANRLAAADRDDSRRLRAVAARALAGQQFAAVESARPRGWLNVLGALDERDLLTDAEWERMAQQCVRGYSVRVRERCRENRGLPLELSVDIAAPPAVMQRWFAELKRGGGASDESLSEEVELQIEPSLRKLVTIQPRQRYTAMLDHQLSPGDHSLHIALRAKHAAFGQLRKVEDYYALSARPSARAQIRERVKATLAQRRATRSEVEAMMQSLEDMTDAARPKPLVAGLGAFCRVVAEASDEDCEAVRGEEIVRELKSAIAIKKTTSKHNKGALGQTLKPYQAPLIRLSKSLPYATSFEVLAVHRGKETSFGTVWFKAGTASADWPLENPKFRGMSDEPIRLILRPSPEPLRDTLEVRYAGESIEFEGVDLSSP